MCCVACSREIVKIDLDIRKRDGDANLCLTSFLGEHQIHASPARMRTLTKCAPPSDIRQKATSSYQTWTEGGTQ